jgi:hypothetical protein
MAPRFAEVADPVGEGVTAISSYVPRISGISLPDLPFDLSYVANQTASLCEALGPGDRLDALLRPVKGVPPPRGAALWLLAAAVLLLLMRCAFLFCASRRIFRTHGQTRHLNKDL